MDRVPVLEHAGVLDGGSYLQVRSSIVAATADAPTAVVTVVDELTAPAESAWAVLTSANWIVQQWPQIPLLVVARSRARRLMLDRHGITRYVPVFESVDSALSAISDSESVATDAAVLHARFRRSRADSPLSQVRELATASLEHWGHPESVPAVRCVTSILVANVLRHTDSDVDVRLELRGDLVTIAVYDDSTDPAVLREASATAGVYVCGLAILSALTRVWGNTPYGNGKTVWAMLGPDDYIPLYR